MNFKFSTRMDKVSGSATREIFKILQRGGIISFAGGLPANDMLPMKEFAEIAAEVLSGGRVKDVMQYGSTEGFISTRQELIKYLAGSGIENQTLDNVIAVSGGQQGIDLVCRAFLDKGDTVLVEIPTYLAVLQIIGTYEAKAEGVKSVPGGLDLNDLEAKIKKFRPKLLYTVPTFSNPTGNTYSAENRKGIVELCSRYGVPVIEDDPYGKLRFSGNPVPPMKAFDTENIVTYITSFSKIVSPGIRMALACGNPEVIRKMTICKQGQDLHTSALSQVIVEEFLKRGEIQKNLDKALPVYRRKKEFMIECLDKYMPDCYRHTDPEGGLFIWGEFEGSTIDTEALLPAAIEEAGAAYVQGNVFFPDNTGRNAVRFNFSNPAIEDIEKGVKGLGAFFKKHV